MDWIGRILYFRDMEFILIIVIIVAIVVLFFAALIFILKGMGFIISINPRKIYKIKFWEVFIGQKKIIKEYKVLEYKTDFVDDQFQLLIKLTDTNYQELLDFISNPNYSNSLLNSKEPVRKLWSVSSAGFYLNTDALAGYNEGHFRLGIKADNDKKTIDFSHIIIS